MLYPMGLRRRGVSKLIIAVVVCVIVYTTVYVQTPLSSWSTRKKSHLKNTLATPHQTGTDEINTDTDSAEYMLRFRTQATNHIVYNRVPKCGSQTVNDVIRNMSKTNGFNWLSSRIYAKESVDNLTLANLTRRIMAAKAPMLFDRHIYFIDFKRFEQEAPVYVNMIRDPIDRLVSWYYFIRFQPGHIRPMSDERQNRTYDECVASGDEECSQNIFTIMPYFCGQDPICSNASEASLYQAIRNVQREFAVVGVIEDMGGFFEVLEYLLPKHFTGAMEYYNLYENRLQHSFNTRKKTGIKSQTRHLMTSRLKYEYVFYFYVKQRFYRLLHHIRKEKLNKYLTTPGRT